MRHSRPSAHAPAKGRAGEPSETGCRVEEVRLGGAVLGIRVHRRRSGGRLKLTSLQGRAANRLKCLAALGDWRTAEGISSEPAGLLRVIVDALACLDGIARWRADAETVAKYVPTIDRESVTGAMIGEALARPRRSDRLLSDSAAGRLVELVTAERDEMQERGLILALHPRDEPAAARALRRAERQRANGAKRAAEYRKRKRLQRANSVTNENVTSEAFKVPNVTLPVTLHIYSKVRDASNVTLRANAAPAAVMTAVAAGAETIPAIVAATGHPEAAVKKALGRLVSAGRILKAARGRYVPARADPDAEDAEGRPGGVSHPTPSRPKAKPLTTGQDGRGVPPPRPRLDREAPAARTAGRCPAPISSPTENGTMHSDPTIELKIITEVNEKGAISRGRALFIASLPTAAADELVANLIESGRVRDLGGGWLGAWVPAIPPAGAEPIERARLPSPRDQYLESEAARALWERPRHLLGLAREMGVSPHSARCALRGLEEDGFLEREGADTYMLTSTGLRLVAQGEFA